MKIAAQLFLAVVCLVLVRLTEGTDTARIAGIAACMCFAFALVEVVHISKRKGRS